MHKEWKKKQPWLCKADWRKKYETTICIIQYYNTIHNIIIWIQTKVVFFLMVFLVLSSGAHFTFNINWYSGKLNTLVFCLNLNYIHYIKDDTFLLKYQILNCISLQQNKDNETSTKSYTSNFTKSKLFTNIKEQYIWTLNFSLNQTNDAQTSKLFLGNTGKVNIHVLHKTRQWTNSRAWDLFTIVKRIVSNSIMHKQNQPLWKTRYIKLLWICTLFSVGFGTCQQNVML